MKKEKNKQSEEAARRARISACCQNCNHRQFDPQRGLLCGLTNDFGDFQNECESFEPTESYIEKKRAEREKSQKGDTQSEEPDLIAWSVAFTYILFLVGVIKGDDLPAATRWLFVAIGIALAGAGTAYYLYRCSQLKKNHIRTVGR